MSHFWKILIGAYFQEIIIKLLSHPDDQMQQINSHVTKSKGRDIVLYYIRHIL